MFVDKIFTSKLYSLIHQTSSLLSRIIRSNVLFLCAVSVSVSGSYGEVYRAEWNGTVSYVCSFNLLILTIFFNLQFLKPLSHFLPMKRIAILVMEFLY